ncbi:MAG: tetratricopeptide repeat protein [Planctomycetota bacterium]|nr:MAG: tetratricopeptide repeat protein [Planctomycetota bacterium]
MIPPKPVAVPWFQPKSKSQLFFIVALLLAAIVGAWVFGLDYIKRMTAGTPPAVIQKARDLMEDRKFADAAAILVPVIQEIEKTRGPEDPSLLKHFDLLAVIYGEMDRHADAEPLWRRAREIRLKNLGVEHPETIGSGDKLAKCLIAQGKFADAEPLLRKSLTHREGYWGAEAPEIMTSLNHMAELFLKQKKYAEAEVFALRAVKIGRAKTGLMPPSYADSMRLLAAVYAGQEKWEDAAPLYDGAVKQKVKLLPNAPHIPPKPGQISHGDFAELCKDYAVVLRKAGKEKEAKELEAKAEAALKPRE